MGVQLPRNCHDYSSTVVLDYHEQSKLEQQQHFLVDNDSIDLTRRQLTGLLLPACPSHVDECFGGHDFQNDDPMVAVEPGGSFPDKLTSWMLAVCGVLCS